MVWSKRSFAEAQGRVKDDMNRIGTAEDPGARLTHAMHMVETKLSDAGAQSDPEVFIYVMHALLEHQRHGGLTHPQVNRLRRIGSDLLRLHGVYSKKTSELRHLAGDLNQAISQVFRAEGRHWESAWHQQVAALYVTRSKDHTTDYVQLAEALRLVRLGFMAEADRRFLQVIATTESMSRRLQALLGHLKARRLAGQFEGATEIQSQLQQEPELGEDARVEIAWEELCRSGTTSGDFRPLILAAQRNGSHFRSPYVLESRLWAYAIPDGSCIDRLTSFEMLRRDQDLNIRGTNYLFHAVTAFERAQDEEMPVDMKLELIGQALADRHQFIAIDYELLTLAAAARQLARWKRFGLATLVLLEYRRLSRQMDVQSRDDLLGICDDLLKRPWFTDGTDNEEGT